MKKPTATLLLNRLILARESEREADRKQLIDQFHVASESIKPLNIIKNTLKQAITSPEIKTGLTNSAMGITVGFAAKKLFVGSSGNPITKLLGLVLEHVIADKTIKNADNIKAVSGFLIKKLTEPVNAK
jgi:hypothetical protein